MFSNVLKISSKGQVVIPKRVRDELPSEFLIMEYNPGEGSISLNPIAKNKDLGGSLKKYAKSYISIDEAREIVKKKVRDDWLRDRY